MLRLSGDVQTRQKEYAAFAARHVSPGAAAADKAGRLPVETIEAFRSAGYLGSNLPVELGGLGLDPVSYGLLTGEIARACSSSRTLMTVHDMVSATIFRWGSTQLKEELLPCLARGHSLCAFALSEMEAGSDAAALQTSLRPEGDNFILNGHKAWISFGQLADYFLIFAKSTEQGICAVLLAGDTPGLIRKPVPGMVGTRAAMMAHIDLDNCYVPKAALIGKPGFGLSHIAQTALDLGRYSVAWGAVGIADAALAASSKFSRERPAFGDSLARQPLMQAHLLRMAAGARAARLMCLDAGQKRHVRNEDAITQTMLAKYFASKIAVESANTAVQVHGARGLLDDSVPERLLRDAKVTEIIEGSTEILELVLGRENLSR